MKIYTTSLQPVNAVDHCLSSLQGTLTLPRGYLTLRAQQQAQNALCRLSNTAIHPISDILVPVKGAKLPGFR